MQIDWMLARVERLSRHDGTILIDEMLEVVLNHYCMWYEAALMTYTKSWERHTACRKADTVRFDIFNEIMKEHNIRFDGDDKEMHQVYDLLLHHVKCSEKNGIDHPRLFAIGACQLGLFPRIPKFGSQAGHTWMYEGESSSIFTNSKLYHIQEEFTQILEKLALVKLGIFQNLFLL